MLKKLPKYISISILPLIAMLVLYILGYRILNTTQPAVHLIPFGFRGPVTITLEDSLATSYQFDKEGTRLYRIPKSGFLRTKHKINEGIVSSELFFFVDSLGVRHQITGKFLPSGNVDSNEVGIYSLVVGVAGNRGLPFISYFVTSLKQRQSFYRNQPMGDPFHLHNQFIDSNKTPDD